MNINWDAIIDKYPRAFEKFINYSFYIHGLAKENQEDHVRLTKEKSCYCDIEHFFESNNIYIIYHKPIKIWGGQGWKFYLQAGIFDENMSLISSVKGINSKTPSNKPMQENAIIKAFDVLEEKLTGGME